MCVFAFVFIFSFETGLDGGGGGGELLFMSTGSLFQFMHCLNKCPPARQTSITPSRVQTLAEN